MSLINYSLIGCPHSEASENLLKKYNIKCKIIKVKYKDKNKFKEENKMNTFPQIFYLNNNNKKIKIGGNETFTQIVTKWFNILDKMKTIKTVNECDNNQICKDKLKMLANILSIEYKLILKVLIAIMK